METSTQKHTPPGVDLAKIRAAIAPVLSAHGVSLADLEWTGDRSGPVLRVTIEREGSTDLGGGVTLEDCADVSRDLSSVLDVEDLVAAHYNLEVSSPGLDRPLRTEADFARFTGRTAKVKLKKAAPDGQRLLRGPLGEAPAGQVAVVVDGKRIEVPFADVAEAKLVFELAPQPKPGKAPAAPGKRGKKSAGKADKRSS